MSHLSFPSARAAVVRSARTALIILVLILAATADDAAAQAVYGSIGGIVKDASGAIVPGATVTVTSLERKTVDTTVSNESGFYVKDRLLPGNYEVKAELPGFKTAVVAKVGVSVDTQTPVDFALELGQLSEQVQVTEVGGSLLRSALSRAARSRSPAARGSRCRWNRPA